MALTCYLDAFSGISGDMTVGALADAGADRDAIADALHSLERRRDGLVRKGEARGIGATKFRVAVGRKRRSTAISRTSSR